MSRDKREDNLDWLATARRSNRSNRDRGVSRGEVVPEGEMFEPAPTTPRERALRMLKMVGDGLEHREDLTHKSTSWAKYLWRERDYRSGPWVQHGIEEGRPGWGHFSRELFADLLEGQGALEKVEDIPVSAQWAEQVHEELDFVAEWRKLRALCHDDPEWAYAGASRVANAVRALQPATCRHDPDQVREMADDLRDQDTELAQELDTIADEQQDRAEHDARFAERSASRIRKAVGESAQEVVKVIVAVNTLAGQLGHGRGLQTANPTQTDEERELKMRMAEMVMQNPALTEIVEVAGRFINASSMAQTEKIRPHVGEVVDIVQGDDVARLTPREQMRLASPDLAPMFFQDLSERKLLCYEMEGEQQVNKGSIILMLDISGSMEGRRDQWAKGVMLAVAAQCRKDRRPLVIGHYNGDLVSASVHVYPYEADALLDELTVGCNGGTNLGNAMATLETGLAADPAAVASCPDFLNGDYLVVTDGADERPASLDRIKAAGKRVFGVFIECEPPEWAQELDGYCLIEDQSIEDSDDGPVTTIVYDALLGG